MMEKKQVGPYIQSVWNYLNKSIHKRGKTVKPIDPSKRFIFSQLPEEEKSVVIDELYERWQDIVYMNAKQRIREMLENSVSVPSTLSTDDEITIRLSIKIVVGDIVQVLGRYRRGKEGDDGKS